MSDEAAQMGHNQPPEGETMQQTDIRHALELATTKEREYITKLLDAAARARATTREEAEKCLTLEQQMASSLKRLEQYRTSAKAPLDQQVQTIQGFFNPLKDLLNKAKSAVNAHRTEYQRELQRIEREAALKAQQEAAKKAAEAATAEQLEQAQAEQTQAAAAVEDAGKLEGQAGTRRSSVRRVGWDIEITDITKVPAAYLSVDLALVRKTLANAKVPTGGTPPVIPGLKVTEKTKAA